MFDDAPPEHRSEVREGRGEGAGHGGRARRRAKGWVWVSGWVVFLFCVSISQ